jgi:sortase A
MGYVRFFGKLLISVGCGVLMFVAWTLWGTGIYTAQQQDKLEEAFRHEPPVELEAGPDVKVPETYAPGAGESAFRLRIPAIDLSNFVVEGVGVEDLKKGPGHYPSCRPDFDRPFCTEFEEIWPGENGRVIVSGHRTTYGAPFYNLDKLKPGDEVITETKWGEFTYEVTKTEIVQPDSLAIAIQNDEPEIVLTTCNPKFSAAQRLVVYAKLVA